MKLNLEKKLEEEEACVGSLNPTVSMACQLGYELDRAKNSVRIEELGIVSEDSEKIVIFRLTRG
jgi:hypothetical protein